MREYELYPGEPVPTSRLWVARGSSRPCIPQTPLMSPVTASLSPGVPFPIIVAWAIGKLYYDNEK